ncbi:MULTISPECIES: HdeD family acid-resistance protein [unclassified Microbacterium]|uniref:HdeD family acid-resistance protein n=1 Tax=unclassified Microbacterium TaxID=2609290 RepID=UPI00301AB96F
MTTTTTPATAPAKGARLALLIGGLAAVGFGIAVLAWPTKAAVALTGVIALYAIIAGVVYAALGLFSKGLGAGGRIGHVLLGVLYVIAGVYAFSSLQQSAAFLALFLTILVGVMWVIEGFTALFTLGQSGSKVLTIVFAILSVIAGFTLLSSPLWGAVFLWWFLAIALIVLGALNVIRAIAGKKA